MTADTGAAEPGKAVGAQPMGPLQRGAIGGALAVASGVLLAHVIALWPAVVAATSIAEQPPPIPKTPLLLGFVHTTFTADVVLIAIVMIAGGLGALLAVTRRFLYYATREELTKRDEWSYLMRPLQGAVLSLIIYFTLRGGYLGQDASAPVNPYGVAALSSLVGLFTPHAMSKLSDVFDTMFGKTKEDETPVVPQPAGGA